MKSAVSRRRRPCGQPLALRVVGHVVRCGGLRAEDRLAEQAQKRKFARLALDVGVDVGVGGADDLDGGADTVERGEGVAGPGARNTVDLGPDLLGRDLGAGLERLQAQLRVRDVLELLEQRRGLPGHAVGVGELDRPLKERDLRDPLGPARLGDADLELAAAEAGLACGIGRRVCGQA